MIKDMLGIVDAIIQLCQIEKENGYSGEATKEQIEKCILPEMYELKEFFAVGKVPERDYIISFANAFKAWDWDMLNATELYRMISKLHRVYHSRYKRGNEYK